MSRKPVKKKKEPKDYDMFVCRVPADLGPERKEFEATVKKIQAIKKANGKHITKAELVIKGCLAFAKATLRKLEA